MQTRLVLATAVALLAGSATIASAQSNPRSRGVSVDTYAPAARAAGVYTRDRQRFDPIPTGSIARGRPGGHPTLADPYGNFGVPRGGEAGGGGP